MVHRINIDEMQNSDEDFNDSVNKGLHRFYGFMESLWIGGNKSSLWKFLQ